MSDLKPLSPVGETPQDNIPSPYRCDGCGHLNSEHPIIAGWTVGQPRPCAKCQCSAYSRAASQNVVLLAADPPTATPPDIDPREVPGLVCEEHPDQVMGHGGCGGAGILPTATPEQVSSGRDVTHSVGSRRDNGIRREPESRCLNSPATDGTRPGEAWPAEDLAREPFIQRDGPTVEGLIRAIERIEEDGICRCDIDCLALSEENILRNFLGVLQDGAEGYDETNPDQPRLSKQLRALLNLPAPASLADVPRYVIDSMSGIPAVLATKTTAPYDSHHVSNGEQWMKLADILPLVQRLEAENASLKWAAKVAQDAAERRGARLTALVEKLRGYAQELRDSAFSPDLSTVQVGIVSGIASRVEALLTEHQERT